MKHAGTGSCTYVYWYISNTFQMLKMKVFAGILLFLNVVIQVYQKDTSKYEGKIACFIYIIHKNTHINL